MICGTCSICGGKVVIPDLWGSVIPATPTCEGCGAEAAKYGDVIQMVPVKPAERVYISDRTSAAGKQYVRFYGDKD